MNLRSIAAGLIGAGMIYAADTAQVVDQVVARVNGDIVSQDELLKSSRELAQGLKTQGESGTKFDQDYSERQKDILRDRIDELLLVQRGKELNINVDSDVTKYMASIQREQVASNPALADTDKFHEFVRAQAGMPWEDFLQETKNNFLKREVIGQEVARKVTVPHEQIAAYYEKHKSEFVREEKVYLSEILVSTKATSAAADAAALRKANDLADRASKGERFAELARDNSDSATAKQGGELAGYKKGELRKDLEDKVWALPKGGITKPIKIDTGYLILKVNDHTKEGQASLEDVQGAIQETLYAPLVQPKVRDYLTGLRKSAYLQIKPGYVDTGAAGGQNTAWQDPAQLKPEQITVQALLEKKRHKRLFGMIPIPGTQTTLTGKSSSR